MAARKLVSHVHAYDDAGNSGVFGPDDKLPAWALKAITNPAAWDGGDQEEFPDANANTLRPEPKADKAK